MSLRTMITRSALTAFREIYCIGPFPEIVRPIFIIGCGRSGTTILGKVLSRHKSIIYLNEPRALWFSAYPETDIWTAQASVRGGELYLSGADVDDRKSKRLRRLFRFEAMISRRRVLVEKLPINNFRLEFVHRIFPDARYIHIYRSALEVARSIERANKSEGWFRQHGYRWRKLVEYAATRGRAGDVLALCATDFEKGLLEWRLSTEAAVSFLEALPDAAYFELSYNDFVTSPLQIVPKLLEFIGLGADPEVDAFVAATVSRRSAKMNVCTASDKVRAIGGKLLPLSMDGGRGLSKRVTHALLRT